MPILPEPKFVANTADGANCGPACLQMAMETLKPERPWTIPEIEKILCKEPGKYTWIQIFYPTLVAEGFAVKVIGEFDPARFVAEGWEYVRDAAGDEVMQDQIDNGPDLALLQNSMRAALASGAVSHELRSAKFDDIEAALKNGALGYAIVNGRKLHGEDGISSHSVLVYGLTETEVIMHDPGGYMTPAPALRVPRPVFDSAWLGELIVIGRVPA